MGYQETEYGIHEYKLTADKGWTSDLSLFGSIPKNENVNLFLSIPRRIAATDVCFDVISDETGSTESFRTDFRGMRDEYELFVLDLGSCGSFFANGGLFFYRWRIRFEDGERFFGGEQPMNLSGTENGSYNRQLSFYEQSFTTPEHVRGGIAYQIMPDRFRRSGKSKRKKGALLGKGWTGAVPSFPSGDNESYIGNEFFGGDLFGVAEKLPYLSSLGVTMIYLNPVFEASTYHRYDTGDMMKVDDSLGGDDALLFLVRKASEYGISVILDGVFNHTGSDSVYFNKFGSYGSVGAYNSKDSKYFKWYFFDKYPDEYRSWWGVDSLPKVNCDDDSYRRFIALFADKWSSYGVRGWRIDVADELSDGFLHFFRELVKERGSDTFIIGEVWEDASNKISYGVRKKYFQGNELDSVMNYPLRDALLNYLLNGDHPRLKDTLEGLYRRYPKPCSDSLLNLLGSHDTERILTALSGRTGNDMTMKEKAFFRLSDKERTLSKKRLAAAYSFISFLPGIPMIYYGDEAGTEGFGDPFCRAPFPWGCEDEELTSHFRMTGKRRREEPVVSDGLFEIVFADERVFAYLRYPLSEGDHSVLVVMNRTERRAIITFAEGIDDADGKIVHGALTVPPLTTIILRVNEESSLRLREERPGFPDFQRL